MSLFNGGHPVSICIFAALAFNTMRLQRVFFLKCKRFIQPALCTTRHLDPIFYEIVLSKSMVIGIEPQGIRQYRQIFNLLAKVSLLLWPYPSPPRLEIFCSRK